MTDQNKIKLNQLAKEYVYAKKQLEIYTKKVNDLRSKILELINNTTYLNESYQFTVSSGSKSTLQKDKVEKTFQKFNVVLDSSYFKVTTYPTLKVVDLASNPEKKTDSSEDDEHRVKVSLDDLKI